MTCGLEGCDGAIVARGWCRRHYTRWQRHGDPMKVSRRLPGENQAWVTSGVAAEGPGECVMMPLTLRGNRPVAIWETHRVLASRAVWMAAHGDPRDLQVLHTCGRGEQGCIRLGHLYLGTSQDNIRDRDHDGHGARGVRVASSKLTPEAIHGIRTANTNGVSQRTLARNYGVSRGTIGAVLAGRTWRHVVTENAS